MRFRVGVVLLLLLTYLGVACRTPLTPNVDRNQAPETWITAAPFDTITIVKGQFPFPGNIPVRFHIYWAGADRDGAVAGFYWAVVETLPLPAQGQFFPPPLPGPKPRDYHFTTRTDSTFIFNVSEETPDRQHAFFIYAVDDGGKPDASPARFIFNAQDNSPPIPVFDQAMAIKGSVFRLVRPGVIERDTTTVFPKGQSPLRLTEPFQPGVAPRDTVPSGSTLYFTWHGEVKISGTKIVGYRYKLDEAQLVAVGPHDTSKVYFSGIGSDNVPPTPGTKVFTIRAVDEASGATTPEVKRQFQYNFSPITWWAGPDLALTRGWHLNGNGEKYLTLAEATGPDGIQGSLMSPDSARILPASRTERRTFLEVWKDTVYARAEFDTVHMNSWVVFHAGGFDSDSPYGVRVNPSSPDLPPPPRPALEPDEANGSPIGFHFLEQTRLDPYSSFTVTRNTQSSLFPLFDRNDVFDLPRIGGYQPMFHSGRAYIVIRAEDGDGATDGRVKDLVGLADKVDDGGGTDAEKDLKNQVTMVFYVNRPAVFLTENPVFFPKLYPPSAAKVDTIRSPIWNLNLLADDVDPYTPGDPFGGPRPGGPVNLRRFITVKWKSPDSGRDLSYTDDNEGLGYAQPNIQFLPPSDLPRGNAILEVVLCDCFLCALPGGGRCVTLQIPVFYDPP